MIRFQALSKFTEQRLNTMCLNFERVFSDPGEESIHDLRVSIRRQISHLKYLIFLYDNDSEISTELKTHHRRLKRNLQSLSQMRDMQTHIRYLEELSGDDPCPGSLLENLKAQTVSKLHSLPSEMDRWNLQKSRRKVRQLMADYPLADKEIELKSHLYLNFLTERLHASVQCCQKPDLCGCHALRIRLKEYRYHLEMLEQGFGIKQILIGAVRQWQDDLGALQDLRALYEKTDTLDWKDNPELEAFRARLQQKLNEQLMAVASEAHAIRFETQIK